MTTEQVSIKMSSDVTYVHGTVNGEVADFELTSPNVWSAVVAKSDNSQYLVEVTAYNSLGTSTTYKTLVLDSALPFKIDWTDQDYYNFYDLNRVEANTQYIAAILSDYVGRPVTVSVITDRDMMRIEFADSLNRVESNQQTLADNFYAPVGWEPPKTNWRSGQPFSYRDANRLERNLLLIYDLLQKAFDSLKYCGTFAAGEDGDIY